MQVAAPSSGSLPTSGFGFEIPQGDPGALEEAATQWTTLATALGEHGETLTAAGEVTLSSKGWQGGAAQAYAEFLHNLLNVLTANVGQCGDAAEALTDLGTALSTAQSATTTAMSDCVTAEQTQRTQAAAAKTAGGDATTAHQNAANAKDPGSVATYKAAASQAEADQRTAQGAADKAAGDLSTAQAAGQKAYDTYVHAAKAAAAKLQAAGDGMKKPDASPSALDTIVTWVGHLNDFSGAAATGLIKGFVEAPTKKLISETENVLKDISKGKSLDDINKEFPLPDEDAPTSSMTKLYQAANEFEDSSLTKALMKGLPEDSFGVLSKVPYVGWVLTAAEMFDDRNDGVKKAVIEPLGNLALGTTVAETTAAPVASGLTALAGGAAGDTVASIVGASAFVPGVGEVVIVGGVTVAVVAGADWVFEHPGEALHGVEDAGKWTVGAVDTGYHAVKHVVHDLEPWNW